MKKLLILISGLLLMCAPVYAGDGDLIVNGNVGVGTMSPAWPLTLGANKFVGFEY